MSFTSQIQPDRLMLCATHKRGRIGDRGCYCLINIAWSIILNRGTHQIWCSVAHVLIGGSIVLRHIWSSAKGKLDFTPKELVSTNAGRSWLRKVKVFQLQCFQLVSLKAIHMGGSLLFWHLHQSLTCSWTDVAQLSCHHHPLDLPRWRQFRFLRSQRRPILRDRSASRPSADPELQCCHHHWKACPRSPLFHPPR